MDAAVAIQEHHGAARLGLGCHGAARLGLGLILTMHHRAAAATPSPSPSPHPHPHQVPRQPRQKLKRKSAATEQPAPVPPPLRATALPMSSPLGPHPHLTPLLDMSELLMGESAHAAQVGPCPLRPDPDPGPDPDPDPTDIYAICYFFRKRHWRRVDGAGGVDIGLSLAWHFDV